MLQALLLVWATGFLTYLWCAWWFDDMRLRSAWRYAVDAILWPIGIPWATVRRLVRGD